MPHQVDPPSPPTFLELYRSTQTAPNGSCIYLIGSCSQLYQVRALFLLSAPNQSRHQISDLVQKILSSRCRSYFGPLRLLRSLFNHVTDRQIRSFKLWCQLLIFISKPIPNHCFMLVFSDFRVCTISDQNTTEKYVGESTYVKAQAWRTQHQKRVIIFIFKCISFHLRSHISLLSRLSNRKNLSHHIHLNRKTVNVVAIDHTERSDPSSQSTKVVKKTLSRFLNPAYTHSDYPALQAFPNYILSIPNLPWCQIGLV